MCLSLSTSWFKLDEYTAEKLVNEIIGLDIKKIELQYKIKADFWRKLQPLLKKEGIEVSSIHNFFPVPEILDKGSGDAFLLTSLDENEFNLAIKYSSRTIEIASEIGASAVIFHCGNVPMPKEKMDRVFKLFDNGNKEKSKKLLEELIKEREEKSRLYFDRLLKALEQLIKIAEKEGVKIGIENRYFPNEIPLPDELEEILKKFDGAPIGYWHDFGHARHLEILGLISHEEWLEKFKEFLIGVHLHDSRMRNDHLAPGTGEIDFYGLKKLLPEKRKIIRVLEVHPKVKKEELSQSFEFLKQVGLN